MHASDFAQGHHGMVQTAPLTIGILLYPGFTLLDMAGPQCALGMHGTTLLLWKDLAPVATDSGITVNPTTVFTACPQPLDVLFVPGGFGTNDAMKDPEIVSFLSMVGASARYVTSVCSGALLLGAAGLLTGYRATTHWAVHDALNAVGATPVRARVVADRNRITGGGVTAGIDFGLTLLGTLRGEQAAKLSQLMMEYDPCPPYDAGTPEVAGAELTQLALAAMGNLDADAASRASDRHREGIE